ncbi:hypothetical protein [Lacipirellula limnantheis]|nr:hypothetical protein [Lacipirellula limnantheis]
MEDEPPKELPAKPACYYLFSDAAPVPCSPETHWVSATAALGDI